MYYLGITAGAVLSELGHDPAACLIKDNRIVAFVEEERFVRVKHAGGFFPVNAIKYCLNEGGVKLDEVKIGYYMNPACFWKRTFTPKNVVGAIRANNYMGMIPKFLKFYFGHKPDVEYVNHHTCHTYSSFPFSGMKVSTCFSIDGGGERTATLVSQCNSDKVATLGESFKPNSMGQFYGQFTNWLGFKMLDEEGKTMGLAPYGEPKYDLSGFIRFEKGMHKVTKDAWELYEAIESSFGTRRIGEIQKIHKDVAASVQKKLEEVSINMVKYYDVKNLTLCGGIALNCKMNGEILNSGLIKDIFVQPVANDAGCAIGAAAYLSMLDGNRFDKLEHLYYGPEYSNEQIKKTLDICKVKYEYHDDIAGIGAELIAKGKIISWFQGRMEGGPRALGGRSILADPSDPKMQDRINYFVKHREPWRPFCPSMLEEDKEKYLENAHEDPFMILTFKIKEEWQKELPAIVHPADKTARPQTVRKSANPLYWKLINNFKKETGVSVVLNTSFNIQGEPIVCIPEDAVRCFFGNGLDYLLIGNYLVKK